MAIVFYQKVFDEGVSGAVTLLSPPQFGAPMARAVRWYILARVTQVTVSAGTPTITINLTHSNSDMPTEFNWIAPAAITPINAATLTVNTINLIQGSVRYTDSGVSVPGAFLRAEFSLGGTNPNAYVEVWITGRDSR